MEQDYIAKEIASRMAFEKSLQCKGCKYCLSENYYHPLGYSFAIKRIVGKREAWIITLGILIPVIISASMLFSSLK